MFIKQYRLNVDLKDLTNIIDLMTKINDTYKKYGSEKGEVVDNTYGNKVVIVSLNQFHTKEHYQEIKEKVSGDSEFEKLWQEVYKIIPKEQIADLDLEVPML